MARTHRHGGARCQMSGCRLRAVRAVDVELPAAWDAAASVGVLTVLVGLCREHGREVERRVRALLEARAEYARLVEIIAGAVESEASMRARVEDLEGALVEAEGALAYERELRAATEARSRRMWRLTHMPESAPDCAPEGTSPEVATA